jgi:transposase
MTRIPSRTPARSRSRLLLRGRSRGGLSTKIVLAGDSRARPVSRVTTGGHRHDSTAFAAVMAGIRICRNGRGRPRTTPGHLLGDKAFSNKAIRAHCRRRGITATIPEKAHQIRHRAQRGSRGGRPSAFDSERCKQRNTAERCINKLKGFRAVATDTTSVTSCTRPPSTSPPSGSGSTTRPMIEGTRPSRALVRGLPAPHRRIHSDVLARGRGGVIVLGQLAA